MERVTTDEDKSDVIDGPTDVINHGVLDHEKGLLLAASKRLESVTVDEILPLIGEYGRSQICLTFLLSLFMFGATYNILSTVFVTLDSPWQCSMYGITQGTCLFNGTIDDKHDMYKRRCDLNRTDWEFERSIAYSIVTEFDLVCEKKVFAIIATSASFFGGAIGTICIGIFSDKYGRKPLLFISYFVVVTGSFIQSFIPSIETFIILRFIVGICLSGVLPVTYIILAELVGPAKRALASQMIWIAFASSLCLLSVQAYLIQEWRKLSRIITAPYLVLVLLWKFIPESIRWLRIHHRTEEAERVLRNIAKFNKKHFPDVKLQEIIKDGEKVSTIALFKNKRRLYTIATHASLWFIHAIIYYGISLATTYLSHNLYTDFILVSAVEVPAVVFSIYSCNRFGRKKTTMIGTFSTLVLLIVIAGIPETKDGDTGLRMARSFLGVLSKFFISISYSSIYLLSSETYPTVVRSRIMCLLECIMLIGGAAAPWLSAGLHQVHSRLPFSTMAFLCLIAALTTLTLKETKDMPTPELLEDKKIQGRKIKSLVDNVRDSYSLGSRASSENRLSVLSDHKQTTSL